MAKALATWLLAALLAGGCLAPASGPTPTASLPPDTPTVTVAFPTLPPTATFTPPPTVTPAMPALQDLGLPTYATNFETAEDWPLGKDSFGATSLQGGQLAIVVTRQGASRQALSPSPPLGDFYIQVRAEAHVCSDEDEYGLIFRVEPDRGHYRFTLTCDGGVRIRRLLKGSSRALVPFVDSNPVVVPGGYARNQLAVLAQGRRFQLVVNGVPLLEAQDAEFSSGGFGLIVSADPQGQATILFDDFAVYALSASAGDSPTVTPRATIRPDG